MHHRHTVSISDDHPHILHSLKMLFANDSRYQVTNESLCGKELLASLANNRTDIVITDFLWETITRRWMDFPNCVL